MILMLIVAYQSIFTEELDSRELRFVVLRLSIDRRQRIYKPSSKSVAQDLC